MNNFLQNKLTNFKKKLFLIFSDLIIIIISLSFAYSLRLEEIYGLSKIDIKVYTIFFIVFFLVFYTQNIYQILLRYFDYYSILKILKSILVCSLILIPINFITYKDIYFPRSISFIAPILIGILILVHRIFINFLITLQFKNEKNSNNILIIGIDRNNIEIIKSIRQNPSYGNIKGLIDINDKYKKRVLNGIKIFKKKDLNEIIINNSINEVIIGKRSLKNKEINKLFDDLKGKSIRVKNLSDTKNYFENLINKTLSPNINFYDIINRPKIEVEKKILLKKILNKNILVTGGGGSIGSELCAEILKHNPKKLFILDNSEISLFNIINKIKKLKNYNPKVIKPLLGDCNDLDFLKNRFSDNKIDEIYHTAAYKHVMFGEDNPHAMIKNNIFGTEKIINFAIFKKVKNFIFISSDKAVNPKSILGHSKKFGEKLVKYLHDQNKLKINTNFTIVRFGNVIGSSGSVIPIFLNQVANSGPLTVTNRKAKRYFMSISEAVQLVINASYLNKKGVKIYALEMGSQINIYDIARRIIRLSGNTVKDNKYKKGDVEIKIIGLKKGEKISEEIALGHNLKHTDHPKIMECDEKINTYQMNKKLKKIKVNLKKKILKRNFFLQIK